jgi:hypothetical protein
MSQRTPVDGKWRDISGPGDEQSMRDRIVAFLTRGFAALPDPKHWYPQRCAIELKRRTYSGHRWKAMTGLSGGTARRTPRFSTRSSRTECRPGDQRSRSLPQAR